MKHDRRRFSPRPAVRMYLEAVQQQHERRALKLQALQEQDGCCLYCFTPLDPTEATTEHRKARKRGGDDTPKNIGASCESCNRAKGSLTERVFLRAIRRPDYKRDPWPLYLACVEIRMKRETEKACRRLRSAIEVRAAA